MTGFDLLIFVTLAIFVAFGAWRGLLREAVSLLTWVLAGVLAMDFGFPVVMSSAAVLYAGAGAMYRRLGGVVGHVP